MPYYVRLNYHFDVLWRLMSTGGPSGAGGAAAHAGIDFQQRLAAWFVTAMLSHLDISPALAVETPLHVERISMETADSVDDFVVTCEGGDRILVQAKTSPSLSSDPGSDFGTALTQFVRQHRISTKSKDIYLFAVTPTASGKIRQQLRKLLQAARYDPASWNTAPLSQTEREVLQAFRTLVGAFSKDDQGNAWKDEQVIAFARKLYIATFDLDDSGSHSRSAYVLLCAIVKTTAPPDLVWSRLIQLCLDAARKRLPITADGLRSSLSRFIHEAAGEAEQRSFHELVQTRAVPSGKEVVLLSHHEHPGAVLLFEMHRFDEHGQRRIRFTRGDCIIASGAYRVLHRAATFAGMERYLLRSTEQYRDHRLIIAPANSTENPELGAAAKARSEWIKAKLSQLRQNVRCLECGLPVSARVAAVVEIDDEEHDPEAGVVHDRCILPLHRVIGEAHNPFIDNNRHLVDFDVALWVEKLRTGQGLLAGLREARNPPAVKIAWNPDPIDFSPRYCIRMKLANGARPPVLRRGKVHRLSLDQARRNLAALTAELGEAAKAGDPWEMTEDGLNFGRLSILEEHFSRDNVSQCLSAEIEPYSRAVGEKYDQQSNYYAPLIAIRVGDTDSYFRLNDACVLLSDVLNVEAHFLNWAAAGILLAEYYLEIIADDDAFDTLMRKNAAQGYYAVIDPMLSVTGNFITGIPIVPISDFVGR